MLAGRVFLHDDLRLVQRHGHALVRQDGATSDVALILEVDVVAQNGG